MSMEVDNVIKHAHKSRPLYFVITILAVLTSISVTAVIRYRYRTAGQEIASISNSHVVHPEAMTQPVCAPPQPPFSADREATIDDYRMTTYKGVSFNYPASLASGIEFQIRAESRLSGETDKPEGVVPSHLAFTFQGPYATRHKSSYFTPEVSIYSVSKYKDALALSNAYVQSLEEDIQSLKVILAERRPSPPKGEIPFLPFGTDATQAFHSHLKYIDFKNGRGLLFLTQFNIEPSLVNNQGLIYTFQGLTDDGHYYVSARFPVTAPSLPPSYEANKFENYSLRMFYGRDRKANEQKYESYLARIERELDDLPSDRFEPSLSLFDKLISSLCVMPNEVK
jgi:hypothetical protein